MYENEQNKMTENYAGTTMRYKNILQKIEMTYIKSIRIIKIDLKHWIISKAHLT